MNQSARERDALFLAAGEIGPPLRHRGGRTFRPLVDEFRRVRHGRGVHHFGVGRRFVAEADVAAMVGFPDDDESGV